MESHSGFRRWRLVLAAAFALSLPATSLASEMWRLYIGGTGTRWKLSHGEQGHHEECRTEACNDDDYRRGNLDSSIGYRIGAERPVRRGEGWIAVAGGDLTLMPTEYNLSQHDVVIVDALAGVGVIAERSGLHYGVRLGAGPSVTDDGRIRAAAFAESVIIIPFHDGGGVRFTVRLTDYQGQTQLRDAAWMLQLGDFRSAVPRRRWGYAFTTGVTTPGRPLGSNRELGAATQWRQTATYALTREHDRRLFFAWTSTAHESRVRTTFLGVPGNERGITIPSFTFGADRRIVERERFGLRLSAGVETAHWFDAHGLLLDDDGEPLEQGLDFAPSLAIETGLHISSSVAVIGRVEQVYWLDLSMGELRSHIGVAVRF